MFEGTNKSVQKKKHLEDQHY